MATLTALLMAAGMSTFSGCDGITPPETPPTLAIDDFPACAVTINGEQLTDETFSVKAEETLNVEVELTLRDGLEPSQLLPVMVHLMMAANNEHGEEMAAFHDLRPVENEAEKDDDSTANVYRLASEWTPEVEAGTYELRLYTAVAPMGSAEGVPFEPVFSSIVEVQE